MLLRPPGRSLGTMTEISSCVRRCVWHGTYLLQNHGEDEPVIYQGCLCTVLPTIQHITNNCLGPALRCADNVARGLTYVPDTYLYRVEDLLDHGSRIVLPIAKHAAGGLQRVQIRLPHIAKGHPCRIVGKSGGIASVVCVAIFSSPNTIVKVLWISTRGATSFESFHVCHISIGGSVFVRTSTGQCHGNTNDDHDQYNEGSNGPEDYAFPLSTPSGLGRILETIMSMVIVSTKVVVSKWSWRYVRAAPRSSPGPLLGA